MPILRLQHQKLILFVALYCETGQTKGIHEKLPLLSLLYTSLFAGFPTFHDKGSAKQLVNITFWHEQ